MKRASGEDLGNDVEAWRQYAASLSPGSPIQGNVSIAQQPGDQTAPSAVR